MTQSAEKPTTEHHRDIRDLEQLRGEIALELHLMSMDMKTHWHALEKKWEALRNDAKLRSGTAARAYAEELKTDYAKFKKEVGAALRH